MTEPTVTQADREAAARAGLDLSRLTERDADALRQGGAWDEWSLVQAFARHRTASAPADLVEALKGLLHAYCSDTGFAAAVRQDTGFAYPWEPGEIAEANALAALAKHGGA